MFNTIRILAIVAVGALAGFASSVQAQSVGGNASLSVSSASANVQIPLPNNKAQYPSVILVPSPATTQEIFYAFGSTNAVTATAGTSAALPAGGICLNLGPGIYVAAVTSTGTGTLRISQASGCTTFSGSSQASSGGAGSPTVLQGTSPWVDNITQFGGSNVVTGTGASGSGIPRVTVSNDSTVTLAASTTGGATTSSTIIPNNTTAIVVKGSPGQLYGVECWNNNTTIAYIKVYDAISATAGSGTPAARYMCPASSSGSGFIRIDTIGRQYLTGITYIVTTGIADNDTTAPAANTYIVNVGYK